MGVSFPRLGREMSRSDRIGSDARLRSCHPERTTAQLDDGHPNRL